MKHHPNKAEWHAYIDRRLSPPVNDQYETHLYSCDHCLSVYTTCIAEQSRNMPLPHDGDGFTENVMKSIRKRKSSVTSQPFYQRTLFHYATAAAITLLLMTSGMFQGILSVASNVESITVTEQRSSLSDHLMNRAGSVLDTLNPTTRRDRHE